MALEINNECMTLKIDGAVIATAKRRSDDWWEVSRWARRLRRDQAITALTIIELLETGHADDDPLVTALREELR
jgi:hypothetical protein